MKAIIAIGTNMGDREQYIENGIAAIRERVGTILARSSTLQTPPYGVTDQPDFLNLAVLVDTELEPEALLRVLHEIEKEQHRKRLRHWGPRTLDLDIIYYEDRVVHTEDLDIPHPDRVNREFVLAPVCEIAPDYVDPVCHRTVRELLEDLRNR